ncbi:MAG: cupin domain-containing protein [Myxococcota bacterium]|nr:cupin domain-containing protein [Myxococcota bacterium]
MQRRVAALLVASLAGGTACGPRDGAATTPAPFATTPPTVGGPNVSPVATDAGPADAIVSEQEKLAAIQKAMNELDEAAQGCWAVAATERFDIEGDVHVLADIAARGAQTHVTRDTTRNAKLTTCLAQLLARYPWAPPLHGQAIQLPFKFRAPDGQNVIDRSLVTWSVQATVSVAVLLDENNSGNGAASMVELAIARGGSTGLRVAERAELWYFLGPASVQVTRGKPARTVAAGDLMYVPAQGARDVMATAGDVHAVVVMTPGGREGTARAGALPTPPAAAGARTGAPIFLPAAAAKAWPLARGQVTILAEPATIKDRGLAASVLELPAGATVPEHAHATETELLYVLSGSGTLTVAGVQLAVTPTSVVQIPPKTKHAFTATADVRAVQLYTPAGPEQRFKGTP